MSNRKDNRKDPVGQLPPSHRMSPSPISLPDKTERVGYYFGLDPQPPLLARSSTNVWALPFGPYNTPPRKQLQNVGNHKLVDMWDDIMASEVFDILEMHSVRWTSVDILRIGDREQKDKPVILWIGVLPRTLTHEDSTPLPTAGKVAVACKQLLEKHNILDVHCEIKESEVYRDATPTLIRPSSRNTPAIDVEVFFTSTIGTCIAAKDRTSEGTFGFYVTFPEHPGKVFGVTCRHVLFPTTKNENMTYHHKNRSQPRHSVILPGDVYLETLKERAVKGGQVQKSILDCCQMNLDASEGQDQKMNNTNLEEKQYHIRRAKEFIQDFDHLIKDLNTKWKTPESRVVGHAVYSPPIRVGNRPGNYTLDWCLYEVDPLKIQNFSGNVIDLGLTVPMEPRLINAMNPNIRNPHKFTYPPDRQWRVQNVCTPLEEMKHPKTFNKDNSPALSVLKRGRTTRVTCGIANEINSYTCTYFSDGSSFISQEWPIIGFDKSFSPFSDRGDSGSLVVDAQGRMGGMLTGGSGYSAKTNVSYATPIVILLEDMEKHGWRSPNTNVAP